MFILHSYIKSYFLHAGTKKDTFLIMENVLLRFSITLIDTLILSAAAQYKNEKSYTKGCKNLATKDLRNRYIFTF